MGKNTQVVGNYRILHTIGKGAVGKVKYALKTNDDGSHTPVAVKILDKERMVQEKMVEKVKREIAVLKRIQHKHVIDLLDVLQSPTKIYMVMELVTGGELFYVLATEGKFNERSSRKYFQQLIQGVEYCHSLGICHRDLKPENLLLDDKGDLKITDFGLAALYSPEGKGKLCKTLCGTPNYVAPEVIQGKTYDGKAADVWSCGVILFVFLAGRMPFQEENHDVLYCKIERALYEFPNDFPGAAKALIKKILVPSPTARLTIPQIKSNMWFRSNYHSFVMSEVDLTNLNTSFKNVDDKGQQKSHKREPSTHLKMANVFDLIAQSGVFNLTPMVQNSPRKKGSNIALNKSGTLSKPKPTQFLSENDPDELLSQLTKVLELFPVGVKVSKKTESYNIKITARSVTGIMNITAQIFLVGENLCCVIFRRLSGDILEYEKLYKKMMKKSSHLVKKSSSQQQQSSSSSSTSSSSSSAV